VTALKFHATMRIRGINPYVLVSAARARRLKAEWRRPMPVLVRVNGEPRRSPWKINMMPAGTGAFYLYLHGDVRRASGTAVGDRVRVEVAFDTTYRGGPLSAMPAWFRAPLRVNARASSAWQALTPSRKKEILRYLMNLKGAESRARNVAKVVAKLGGARNVKAAYVR
jgi:hypothetical protein